MSAPATLAVEVTADDIAVGQPTENCLCPVALAFKQLPGVTEAWVEFEFACVTFADGSERNYALTAAAADWIRDFDEREAVEPFTFTAELTEEEL